jgi:hypothetical protein
LPDTSFFYCERCGTATFLGGTTPGAHYCPGCRRYTCHDCWDGAVHRCVRCAIEAPTGITVARAMLGTLRSVREEISALTAREANAEEPGAALEIERRLLEVKSASLAAAIERALADPNPRQAVTARSLRRAALGEMERIPGARVVSARSSRQHVPTRNWLGLLATRRPTRIDLGRLRMAALVLIAVAWSVGILLVARLAATDRGLSSGPTSTPEGQVAGGIPTQSPQPTPTYSLNASPATPVSMTFDELITDAVPAGWDVRGGTALGVPFPNAVDRSVRLETGGDGGRASFCTPLPAGQRRSVTAELLTHEWSGAAVTLDGADASVGLAVGPEGAAHLEPGAVSVPVGPIVADVWYRVGFSLDPGHDLVTISLGRREGAERAVHQQATPAGWAGSFPADTRLCISAPAGAGSELYVDNVTVE